MKEKREKRIPVSGHRTNIRMSKLARTRQSAEAEINWSEMVKMLFQADPHQGRPAQMRRMASLQRIGIAGSSTQSYNPDQFQSILILVLVISIVEKRTQEMYLREFADPCDRICGEHKLGDDQYWTEGQIPKEWAQLSQEFEQKSLEILIETLREYHQDQIADQVEADGPDQLFSIIHNLKSQFVKVLQASTPSIESIVSENGSIPETLQPLLKA